MEFKQSKLVQIIQVTDNSSQYIVNGIPQVITQSIVVCPNCKNQLLNLGQNLPEDSVYLVLSNNYEDLKTKLKYCPKCGCKLLLPEFISN